ncbi:Atrophin-1 superfamily incomplete domain containing protein [Pandoravirus celtis]|uniref:Atrophin-1 superfamily incomplete domain containing protein n=1 Tax=Pandoravirus celtis TaxID=2568002 RepID=A0A4D6EIY6_9VIRU|nr:Atrophin-1 superfamily incomplete domain containing protein [Pandoravirus celtis]
MPFFFDPCPIARSRVRSPSPRVRARCPFHASVVLFFLDFFWRDRLLVPPAGPAVDKTAPGKRAQSATKDADECRIFLCLFTHPHGGWVRSQRRRSVGMPGEKRKTKRMPSLRARKRHDHHAVGSSTPRGKRGSCAQQTKSRAKKRAKQKSTARALGMNTKGWYSRRTVVAIRATSDAIAVPRPARGRAPDQDDPLGVDHEGTPASGNGSPVESRSVMPPRKRPLSRSAAPPAPKRTCDWSPPADDKQQDLNEAQAHGCHQSDGANASPRAQRQSPLCSAAASPILSLPLSPVSRSPNHDALHVDGDCAIQHDTVGGKNTDDGDDDGNDKMTNHERGDDIKIEPGRDDAIDDSHAANAIKRPHGHTRQRRSWSDDSDNDANDVDENGSRPQRAHCLGTDLGACNGDSDLDAQSDGDLDGQEDSGSNLGAQSDDDDDDLNPQSDREYEPTAEDWQRSPATAVAMGLRAEARRLERLCRVNEAVWRQTESALEGVRYAIKRLDRMAARGH